MAFTKGQERHPNAGRKKGTLNKRTVEFQEKLKKHKCDPQAFLADVMTGAETTLGEHAFHKYIRQLVESFSDGQTMPTQDQWDALVKAARSELKHSVAGLQDRLKIAEILLPYIAPKLKAIEHSGEIGNPDLADLAAGARDLLAARLGGVPVPKQIETPESPKED